MGRETVRLFPDGTSEQNTIGWGGEVIAHKMRRGRWQWFHRDVRQRDIWTYWDNASDAGLQPVARTFDKASRLLSIANDVSTITYTYDAAGQVLSENNAIAGGPSGGLTQSYYRLPNGSVSLQVYPNGTRVRRDYNARGELVAVGTAASGAWAWASGGALAKTDFTYYPDGKPFWTTRSNGTQSRHYYDGKGNLSVSEHFLALGGLSYAGGTTVLTLGQSVTRGRYTLGLKPNGNLVLSENGTQRWASGTSTGHTLVMQTDGNLVLYSSGGTAVWASWTQGNAGAQFVFQEDGNLVVYSGAGVALWASNTSGQMGASLAMRSYGRDNRDRIVAIAKGLVSGDPLENGRSDRFVYDAEGQLIEAYYDAQYASGPVSGEARKDLFTYDQLGNRKSAIWQATWPASVTWTRRDDTAQNATMNGLNQVKTWMGGLPANWDDQVGGLGNGVLIQDGIFTAWYNALNQPMWSATTSTPEGYANFYGYDPLGRCVKRWYGPNNPSGAAVTNNPATYFYYDGWSLIQEGDSSGAAAQIYLHGARVDEIVARYRTADAKWYFHHYDGRTHCQVVTTTNGAVAEQYQYDAFGWPYLYTATGAQLTLVNGRPVSAIGNRFLFTGREWLTDWGVYDYRHRQYHPGMGRFVQPDPKHFGAGDYNLYRYCHNDPVNHVDPDGLEYNGVPSSVQIVPRRTVPNYLGQSIPEISVRAIRAADGSIRLRLDVGIGNVLVAGDTNYGGRDAPRTDNAKGWTLLHEIVKHGAEWRAWHDAMQGQVSNQVFSSPEAAEATRSAEQKRFLGLANAKNEIFNKHIDPKTPAKGDVLPSWDTIYRNERPGGGPLPAEYQYLLKYLPK